MKSIDEIKKGLEDGAECSCCDGGCKTCADVLALIQQLEAEKDAAVDALTKIIQKHDESYCEYCNNWDRYTCPPSCRTWCEKFEWRGVQKEDDDA